MNETSPAAADDPTADITFDLCGESFSIPRTFRVIKAVEAAVGLPCIQAGAAMTAGNLTLTQVALIAHAMVKVANKETRLTVDEVGEHIFEHGMQAFTIGSGLASFLMSAFRGNQTAMAQMREAKRAAREKEAEAGDAEADPPKKAASRTGRRSSKLH